MTSPGVLEARRWEGSGPFRQSGWWSSGRACWAGACRRRSPSLGNRLEGWWAAQLRGPGGPRSRPRVRLPWEAPARGEGSRLCALPHPQEAATGSRNSGRSRQRLRSLLHTHAHRSAWLWQQHQPGRLARGAVVAPGGGQSPGRARALGVQLCGRRRRTTDTVCVSVTLLLRGRSARPWERDAGRHLPLL